MILINANVFTKDGEFKKLDLEIDDNKKIKRVEEKIPYKEEDMVIDCEGYMITPGFVDVHVHGCAGTDASDGTREALENMAKYLVANGTTSFCPTTMTMEKDAIKKAMENIKDCMDKPVVGARILGVNMEGPYISEARKGAQKADHIKVPDFDMFMEMYKASGDAIKLVDIAPETDVNGEFVKKAKQYARISIAHTTADYECAKKSFDAGISHATHLFNAMSGMAHREPGVVGAVFDDNRVNAELVCDGHHVHPAVLRTAFKVLGDRAIIVSDAMRGAGLPEGEVLDLGGQDVTITGGKATLSDGTIAGSVTCLHEEIKNLVSYGIPLETALKSATILPAMAVGEDDKVGSIEVGKYADLVVMDDKLEIVAVYH